MKKLESLKTEKFKVSEMQLDQIKGGYSGGSHVITNSVYNTALAGGGTTVDMVYADATID